MKDNIHSNTSAAEREIFDLFSGLDEGKSCPVFGALITPQGFFAASFAEKAGDELRIYGIMPLPPHGPGRAEVLTAHRGSTDLLAYSLSICW
jgi:hypothetical protein